MLCCYAILLTLASKTKDADEPTGKLDKENTKAITDLFRKLITEVREKYYGYAAKTFSVLGNIEYQKKQITMGTMEESMGENLAFHVVKGK